ncbi:23S rRNA pseudouridine(2604) synthase [Polaromonas vacuolata]|uniref:Dual-specificity RNA pseudouridine synthase RluF n=1 Tax=Polaromonas vacuolata TaxID=37448 RepID=A0A6H2HDQ8_9BURK|nr:rRNA pseudouridine synthase [Polaromonas vacuolata]QJC57714.1 23S rRNA pseudouridine(2604) synthase [Polaromonas vacuolata]
MQEPIRLAKRLAEMLRCSRSEAEQYIAGGWVRVDGTVVEEPQFRVANQAITVDKDASLLALAPVTLLLHKPAGYVADLSLATRSKDDKSGIRQLKKHMTGAELVTPLALPASGLVVFSEDWRVVRKLREDAAQMEHEVLVDVEGDIKSGGLERLNRADHGYTFNGRPLPPTRASWQSETRLRFAVKGEIPGQLAYLCEAVGLKVTGMRRLRIGQVSMSGLLPGQWRYLAPNERF